MLPRQYTGQKAGYWHNYVLQKFRRNGDIRIFVLHSHKENGDAHVWHLRKDNGDTHDIYVTFAQRKVGQSHSKKEAKRFGSPHNIRVMYEIIRNKAVFILNKWKNIVWQSHKIKRNNSNGKLKDICGSPQGRIQLSYLGGRGGERTRNYSYESSFL